MADKVVRFEVGGRDLARTKSFYEDLFGWQASEYGPAFTVNTEAIPGILNSLGHEPENYVLFYVEVDDVAAAIEKAIALGGVKKVGPIPIPMGTFAWIADPDGNLVGLWKPAQAPPKPIGKVVWQDLTVANPEVVRDFYRAVVGWEPEGLDMGGYEDYVMNAAGGSAGICSAQGVNADLPPQWLVYITVESVDRSIEQVLALGGKVLNGPREMGDGKYAVIQDPAGAVCALMD